MKNYDLSILIPARNEMFLARTIQDILEHKEGNTEIITVLDGAWADPGIPDHPDVTIIYLSESIGQRAATNMACKLSKAKYVMKCDAHCSFEQGFDVKLMADMRDDWTMVPTMRNLHAFNWVCPVGHTRYQGPSGACDQCGAATTRDVVWIAKTSPQSNSYRFDKTLHFQYFKDYERRDEFKEGVEGDKELNYTMSLQGSCFMMTREKYWELNICDEGHGSWGQQGVEVACKTWLSGGKVVVNRKTWYAHMFRTQGGDFGFPYEISGKDVEKARKYSKDLFIGNNWPQAKYDLKWLLDRFYPLPDWHDTNVSKGMIFYTDNQLNLKIAKKVQDNLLNISRKKGIPIVSASLKPMPDMGRNIHVIGERGWETYFKQILAALEASDADVIYMCEHDVLYAPEHFDFVPTEKDKFYYNQNFWKVRTSDWFAVHWDANQVSGLVAYRETLLDFYRKRVKELQEKGFNRSYEPGGRDSNLYRTYMSARPNIDYRHGENLTKSKWSPADFRDKSTCVNWQEGYEIPGWSMDRILV